MALLSLVFFLLMDMVLSVGPERYCPDYNNKACVFVDNQCPFTLYLQRTTIDGAGTNETSPTYVTTLAKTKQTVLDITEWAGLGGQRLYAWWQNPIGQDLDPLTYRDKVEINRCASNKLCYNPTAVDYFGLPVKIGPYRSSDCPSVSMTGAYNITVNEIESQCPTQYTATPPHGVCLSPQRVCWCDSSDAMCSAFDTILRKCSNDGYCSSGLTTPQVYACSGSLSRDSQDARLCAALNRGRYSYKNKLQSQSNSDLFYQSSPYNEYAKFIHTGGAQEFAFPYDDYGVWTANDHGYSDQSGYRTCETNFLSVTFCPGSADVDITTTTEPRETSCGHVPTRWSEDLTWATTIGRHQNPEWYPDFEVITGVTLSQCTEEDMQLYMFCKHETNFRSRCGGLERPCNRICGADPTLSPSNRPTPSPSKSPTPKPTTPYPTEPSVLACGEVAVGQFNDVPITFYTSMVFDGELIFDASGSNFVVTDIEAFSKLGSLLGTDSDHDEVITLPTAVVGDYKFIMMGQTAGIYNIQVRCVSNQPTPSPTKDPTTTIQPSFVPTSHPFPLTEPAQSPTKDPTGNPSYTPTDQPISTNPSTVPTANPSLSPVRQPNQYFHFSSTNTSDGQPTSEITPTESTQHADKTAGGSHVTWPWLVDYVTDHILWFIIIVLGLCVLCLFGILVLKKKKRTSGNTVVNMNVAHKSVNSMSVWSNKNDVDTRKNSGSGAAVHLKSSDDEQVIVAMNKNEYAKSYAIQRPKGEMEEGKDVLEGLELPELPGMNNNGKLYDIVPQQVMQDDGDSSSSSGMYVKHTTM
eukprot:600018_1